MGNNVQFRGPKRRIERVNCRFNSDIDDSAVNKICHTVEDRKTLVRAIIQLDVAPKVATANQYHIVLHREPHGTSVASPGTTEGLDADMFKEQLWEYFGAYNAGSVETNHIEVDLKSMRKLDPGDEVVLRSLGVVANGATLAGMLTLFFKE